MSPFSEAFGDYLLQRVVELHHSFKTTKLTRGSRVLDLGKDYNIRPRANLLALDEDVQEDWGGQDKKLHPPDASSMREHTLERPCNVSITSAVPPVVPRPHLTMEVTYGVDSINNGASTQWNVSWVALDDTSGWVLLN